MPLKGECNVIMVKTWSLINMHSFVLFAGGSIFPKYYVWRHLCNLMTHAASVWSRSLDQPLVPGVFILSFRKEREKEEAKKYGQLYLQTPPIKLTHWLKRVLCVSQLSHHTNSKIFSLATIFSFLLAFFCRHWRTQVYLKPGFNLVWELSNNRDTVRCNNCISVASKGLT